MKTVHSLSKIALAVSLSLALAFTLSCSSDSSSGGGEENNSSSSEGGINLLSSSSIVGVVNSSSSTTDLSSSSEIEADVSSSSVISSLQSSSSVVEPSSSSVLSSSSSIELSSSSNEPENSSSSMSSSSEISSSSVVQSSSSVEPSSSSIEVVYGESVTCGEETYPTVVIGSQTWFAKNLNIDVDGSKCYDDDPANCEIYGRLYDWDMAQNVCPVGWHLPTNDEWNALMTYVGGDATAGRELKATSGWDGIDKYGFAALPGGGGYDGVFYGVGYDGIWWGATEDSADYAYSQFMGYDDEYAGWSYYDKTGLQSVRCIKD